MNKSTKRGSANSYLTHTKNNRGITLIALVITIIVLLILAGITISMVLGDDGIIAQAQEARQAQEKTEIRENAEIIKSSVMVQYKSKGKDLTQSELTEIIQEEFEGGTKNGNKITTADGKYNIIVDEDLNIRVEENEEEVAKAKQWRLPENDTEVNVGDLLTPTVEGLENEKFYVLADDGKTLTLLAERCINTRSNTQEDSMNWGAAFDEGEPDANYENWYKPGTTTPVTNVYANSSIRGLVNAYVETLTGLDLEDVEVAYGGDPVTGEKGRLMWYEEAEPLKNTYRDMLYGDGLLSYWLGSPCEDSSYVPYVWVVCESYEFGDRVWLDNFTFSNVRPVIKILKSNV